MSFDLIFFFVIAAVAIGSALLMITRANPVKSVLFLILNFFCLAMLYLVLHAQFIAIIQIIVYAGAIMVLFLFVIMLLNLGDDKTLAEKSGYGRMIAVVLAVMILIEIAAGVSAPLTTGLPGTDAQAAEMGTVESIGRSLYTGYLFPFEVTSMLLLVAIIGVIVLAKKKFR